MSTATIPTPQAAPPPPAPFTEPAEAPTSMLDRAVCITVELNCLGNRSTVPKDLIDVDADKDILSVSKTLIDSPELVAIKRKDQQIRSYLYSQCIQSGFRWGFYLVPYASIERVEAQLKKFSDERQVLVEALLLVYLAQVEAAQGKRRAIYNRSEYRTLQQAQASFSFTWQYVQFGVPGKLKSVSKAMFEAEQGKAKAKWAEAEAQVQQLLRASMAELVDHMVEKLTGTREGGKPKIFKDSMVANIKEFLDTFRERNITDDGELDGLVERARLLMDGVDPASLRGNDSMRAYVRDGFSQIQASLDGMIVDRPARSISFEDE